MRLAQPHVIGSRRISHRPLSLVPSPSSLPPVYNPACTPQQAIAFAPVPPPAMKFIDIPALTSLASTLTHDGPECSVHTRIEAYSCKPINRDKKLFKSLEHAYADDLAHSPPLPAFVEPEAELATPFGPIDRHASRKTLYLLIAALNVAFPDHEFSDVKPAQFAREESGAAVLNALSTTLTAARTFSAYPRAAFFPSSVPTSSSPTAHARPSPRSPPPIVSGTHPALYRVLDDAIGLADCDVFSYSPDIDADPHANDDEEEWDAASVGDEDGSSGEEDPTFAFELEFDDEKSDGEELAAGRQFKSPRRRPKKRFQSSSYPSSSLPAKAGRSIPRRPPAIRMRRRGGLLWSSHWFFLNRKLKRILFISVWARSRATSLGWSDSDESDLSLSWSEDSPVEGSERFKGWDGAAGAGARALGLHTWA
jgi:hypothetical protein